MQNIDIDVEQIFIDLVEILLTIFTALFDAVEDVLNGLRQIFVILQTFGAGIIIIIGFIFCLTAYLLYEKFG